MSKVPISFADYLKAAERLGAADPDTRRRIAEMLGFDWQTKKVLQTPRVTTPLDQRDLVKALSKAFDPASVPVSEKTSDAPEVMSKVEDLWLEDLPPRTVRLPQWISEVQPMAKPVAEERDEPPEVQPLFMPRWTRALLYAALAHVDHSGPIDIERAVERLARFEPVTQLPRSKRFHLKNDLQLLIDVNQTMQPFAQDQSMLIGNIKRLVAAQHVEEMYFSGCPTFGAGLADEWPWKTYRAPRHPGTLVVVLSDLCATRTGPGVTTARTEDWLSFARLIAKSGCQSVALVPFPLRRVRTALRRAMVVIPWDRSTTTGMVQKIRFTGK